MNSSTTDMPLVDHALRMATKGWSIIPVHDMTSGKCSCKEKDKCRTPGKHPRPIGWTKKSSRNADQIVRWWKHWPNANIGIVTGTPSGIMVLDFDVKSGGEETLTQLRREFPEIQHTFRVKTGGGGWQLYFLMPEGGVGNSAGILPGLDIRGENGMVVAAGSTHYSGNKYEIQHDAQVIALPDGLRDRLRIGHKRDTRTTQEQRRNTQEQRKQERETIERPRKKQVVWESLSSTQQAEIDRAIQLSLPAQGGQRNANTFDFTRRLQSVEGFEQTTDPETLRQIVKRFQGAIMATAQKNGFVVSGSFVDTFNDVRYAWDRIHTPIDQMMAAVIERCLDALNSDQLPEPVADCLDALEYSDDDDTAALILLCWHLDQHWKGTGFFLACRAGESALKALGASESATFQWVNRRMAQLERDGVIFCSKPSKPGQRGTASEFIWTWSVPESV